MQLIIVESPHKAKTIEKFLKGDFKVDASKGHVRDLPVNYMGVSIHNNFEPHYVVAAEKKQDIKRLEAHAAKAEKRFQNDHGSGTDRHSACADPDQFLCHHVSLQPYPFDLFPRDHRLGAGLFRELPPALF